MSLIDTEDAIESILFMCRNVKVYKIPARPTLAGWKAQEWGDSSFMWEGRLRIVETGDEAVLKLEDSATGELFANCPYDSKGTAVESVLDSSRYFVLRIVDEQGRKASVGMGFEERGDAFDFNVALQDHTKRLNAPTSSSSSSTTSSDPSKPPEPKKDYSLKPGQSFTISVPGGGSGKTKEKKAEPAGGLSGGGAGAFMLPPPPSGRKR